MRQAFIELDSEMMKKVKGSCDIGLSRYAKVRKKLFVLKCLLLDHVSVVITNFTALW